MLLLAILIIAIAMVWAAYLAARRWGGLPVCCGLAGGIDLLHAFADWTGWLNFGHHPREHASSMLLQALLWLAIGAVSLRHRRTAAR
jgi:hypothetical protein